MCEFLLKSRHVSATNENLINLKGEKDLLDMLVEEIGNHINEQAVFCRGIIIPAARQRSLRSQRRVNNISLRSIEESTDCAIVFPGMPKYDEYRPDNLLSRVNMADVVKIIGTRDNTRKAYRDLQVTSSARFEIDHWTDLVCSEWIDTVRLRRATGVNLSS